MNTAQKVDTAGGAVAVAVIRVAADFYSNKLMELRREEYLTLPGKTCKMWE